MLFWAWLDGGSSECWKLRPVVQQRERRKARDDFGVILMEGSCCSRNEHVTNNIFVLFWGTEFVSVCETNQFFKKKLVVN